MNESETLREQLYGTGAHMHVMHALEGLHPSVAGERVSSAPHTAFQILQHMIYWQDITVARLRREAPERPASAELGWRSPPAPEDAGEWEGALACLAEGLRSLESMLADPSFDLDVVVDPTRGVTAREEILMIQTHNSYHLGQIVTLRQALGAWPPPRGGGTW